VSSEPQCQAHADEPPHYLHTHQCSRRATTERIGGSSPTHPDAPVHLKLCTQHARQVDRRGTFLLTNWARYEIIEAARAARWRKP
jgi:hypothetical protein